MNENSKPFFGRPICGPWAIKRPILFVPVFHRGGVGGGFKPACAPAPGFSMPDIRTPQTRARKGQTASQFNYFISKGRDRM